ncbi:MAG: S1C family serine protease [Opitutaceae bacterium]
MLPSGGRTARICLRCRHWGIACAAAIPGTLQAGAALDTVELFNSAAPAVVRVVIAEEPDEKGLVTKWAFSGCFIDEEGRVVTNSASGAPISRIWVEKDGLSYLAELIGSDPQTNIALIQLIKLPEDFGTLSLDDTRARAPVGTPVMRISSPLELDPSPALGLITGHESSLPSSVFPFTYTRINLPAGPGDGGAPVVNESGQLVGITVASVPEISSSYLVPASALKRIVSDLQNTGRVSYGSLPIQFGERADPTNVARQVVVLSVEPDSTASRADVRPGDIVRRIGSTSVRRINDVRDELFAARPGQFITLEVERNGKRIPFALPVDEQPIEAATRSATAPVAGPVKDGKSSGTPEEPSKLQPPTRPAELEYRP